MVGAIRARVGAPRQRRHAAAELRPTSPYSTYIFLYLRNARTVIFACVGREFHSLACRDVRGLRYVTERAIWRFVSSGANLPSDVTRASGISHSRYPLSDCTLAAVEGASVSVL